MNTYLECIPCFFKQALEAAKIAGADKSKQREVLNRVALLIPNFSLKTSPPEMGREIYGLVRQITGNKDPYEKIKEKYNSLAMKLYPDLKKMVKNSSDPLLTAVRLAVTGNIIDFGVSSSFDLEKEIEENIEKKFPIFDYDKLTKFLKNNPKEILYLADNTGEIVFDKILIEELNKYTDIVIFAVKESPVINDALIKDAIYCGIDKIAKVISCGSDAPGTVLKFCSDDFIKIFNDSLFIISKGQGNYEALAGNPKKIFFIFKAKCPVIAKHVGCKLGDIILKCG